MSKIQIRRGLEANRLSVTPENGELLWTTDEKRLFIGDGTTAGGISATAAATGDYILTTDKGAAGGVAELDAGGQILTAQLPALALTAVTAVADEAAMVALTAEEGDVAIRTDLSQTFVHNGGTVGDATDWTVLSTPTDVVTSVNTKTGVITLTTDDVAEGTTNQYFTTTRLEALINDASSATNETWSANKIAAEIAGLIDDTIVDTDNNITKTLSADKIYSIAAAGGDSAVSSSIDDTTVATDTLWSSSKTQAYADGKIDDSLTTATTFTWSVDKIKNELGTVSAGWTGVSILTEGSDTGSGTSSATQGQTHKLVFASDDGLGYTTADIRGMQGATGSSGISGNTGASVRRNASDDAYDASTGILTIGMENAPSGSTTFTSVNITTGDLRQANTTDIIDDTTSATTTTYSSTKIEALIASIDGGTF